MKRLAFIAICCLYLLSASAGNLAHGQQPTAADSIAELPLPNVPATLRQPTDRAGYIIGHFWDAMDFSDTRRSCNRDFMEQNFSNFISVFPYADEAARRAAVKTLTDKAEADSTAYALMRDIAEKYLYEPDSPMLSEDYYMLFLERFVSSAVLGEYTTLRMRRQLEAASKNRPGTTAADFAYTTRDGRSTTLHATAVGRELLLIFYDPDCEHCQEVMGGLQQSSELKDMTADGRLSVVAIYSGDDHDLWQHTASQLPADWVVGYDSGELQENGAYVLRTMPTLYLLDRDKKVVRKDVSPAQLFSGR